jgi:type IV secretion system protein VirB10
MNENNKIELDDLGIVDDLNEEQGTIQKEKAKVILIVTLLIAVLGYMGYSAFKPKEKTEEKVKESVVYIKKKKFDAPPVNTPKEQKVEIELPTSPLEKPKVAKVAFKVNKNSRGSIINFNSPVIETKSNPNQVDVNFFNNSVQKQQASTPPVSSKKKPTMYKGGDYAIAGVSRHNPSLSLAKGAYIECTMVTRIVSSYSGNTKCITSEDIYSTNGVTLLMEKGSTVTGHFKGGSIENGVERLFVIWDELRTPNNVVINISSQATGELGATGVSGYVDNHWAMRFGSAVLISILDIGAEALRNKQTNGDTTNINYGQGTSPLTNMANTALEQFINIKPTFYKNHGDVVGIYVEKDLDFSKVYRLK